MDKLQTEIYNNAESLYKFYYKLYTEIFQFI